MANSMRMKYACGLSTLAMATVMPGAAQAQSNNDNEVLAALSSAPSELADALLATSADDLPGALMDLAGSDYAQHLYSYSALGMRQNDMLAFAGECEVPELDGYEVACSDGLRIYAGVDYANYRNDGGDEAGRIEENYFTGALGADYMIGDSAVVGGNVAKIVGQLDSDNGLDLDIDGWRVGGYGTLDNGVTYVTLLGSYGWYGNKGDRQLDYGNLESDLTADFDVTQYTLGAHAGVRFAVGVATMLPYLNLDYVSSDMDGFTEGGGLGALAIDGVKDERLFSTMGFRFNSDIGGIVASANLGWRHVFDAEHITLSSRYAGYSGTEMSIQGEPPNGDSAVVGVGFGGKAGKVDFRANFDAIFDGHETTKAIGFRLRMPLG